MEKDNKKDISSSFSESFANSVFDLVISKDQEQAFEMLKKAREFVQADIPPYNGLVRHFDFDQYSDIELLKQVLVEKTAKKDLSL